MSEMMHGEITPEQKAKWEEDHKHEPRPKPISEPSELKPWSWGEANFDGERRFYVTDDAGNTLFDVYSKRDAELAVKHFNAALEQLKGRDSRAVEALRAFVDGILDYEETGVWPDNHQLRTWADFGSGVLKALDSRSLTTPQGQSSDQAGEIDPRDWPDGGPGDRYTVCPQCGETFRGPQNSQLCKVCSSASTQPTASQEEPKIIVQNINTGEDTKRLDLVELAWGIIANAGGGDWERESKDWQDAAVRWRDTYFGSLREVSKQSSEQPNAHRPPSAAMNAQPQQPEVHRHYRWGRGGRRGLPEKEAK